MVRRLSRREVLKTLVSASAACALGQSRALGHARPDQNATIPPLNLLVTAITDNTLRINFGGATKSLTTQNDSRARVRSVYLPKGTWIDFWTNETIDGGREITREVDLATTPLYVRAGAVIPFGPVRQYTEERVDGPIVLRVYPGSDGEFTLYEDDGRTFNFRRGEWTGVRLKWEEKSRLSLALAQDSKMIGADRVFEVQLGSKPETSRIVFTGRPVSVRL